MRRVTGVGGIFLKAKDPAALGSWYKRHLGVDVQPWGGAAFDWVDSDGKPTGGTTAWSVFPERVTSLRRAALRLWSIIALRTFRSHRGAEGRRVQTSWRRSMSPEYGKFAGSSILRETR